MKTQLKTFCFIVSYFTVAYLFAQEPHLREAKPVEQLIYEKDPNKAITLFNKGNYVVVENLRKIKRKRYYEGDIFRFKTKDGFIYENPISNIRDSSFTVTIFNEVSNRYEYVDVKVSEITKIYKFEKRHIRFGLLNLAPFGYLFFDWAVWKTNPMQKLPLAIALSVAQPSIQAISNSFRSRKITENYRVRVLKSF